MTDLVIDDRYATLQDCLWDIRVRYHRHDQIAELGSTTLVCKKPEWERDVLDHLEMILDDLGTCAEDSWNGARNVINNGPYLEKCPNIDNLHNSLVGMPAVCLGAGPTAAAYLDHIDPTTSVVFCTDAMLAGCGFIPQFTTMTERLQSCLLMTHKRGREGSRLIALPVIDPSVAHAFLGKCLWWLGSDPLYQWLSPGCNTAYAGRSSGVLSIAAALLAGCDPIYLVGHDLAYRGTETHASTAHAIAPLGHDSLASTAAHVHHMKRYQVEANAGGTVETCGLFNVFRQDIEHIIRSYPGRTVINCGGLSKIAGTVMGDLPKLNTAVQVPEFEAKPLKNWHADKPRIIENIRKLQNQCATVIMRLEMDANVEATAEMLAISKIVDADLAQLFHYIFRTLSHTLNLRLNYRARHGYDHDKTYRDTVTLLANTMCCLCAKMVEQLA